MSEHVNYTLSYGPKDNPRRSGLGSGGSDLADAIVRIARDVAYYQGLGYVVTLDEVWVDCPGCNGEGQIPWTTPTGKRRLGKFRVCPKCKGKNSRTVLAGNAEFISDPCVVIRNSA